MRLIWAASWQNQQDDCVPSKESDQAGHPPSLISLRCALSGSLRTQAFFMRTVKTLIRLGGCPGWSESSLGTHAILLVLSWSGSFVRKPGSSCGCQDIFSVTSVPTWLARLKMNEIVSKGHIAELNVRSPALPSRWGWDAVVTNDWCIREKKNWYINACLWAHYYGYPKKFL